MSKLHAIIGSLICAMNWTRRGTPKMSNLNDSRWKRQTWSIFAENTITACFTQAKRICKQQTYTVYRQKHSTTSAKNRKNHSFEKKSHWNSNFHGDNAALIALSTCQICWEKKLTQSGSWPMATRVAQYQRQKCITTEAIIISGCDLKFETKHETTIKIHVNAKFSVNNVQMRSHVWQMSHQFINHDKCQRIMCSQLNGPLIFFWVTLRRNKRHSRFLVTYYRKMYEKPPMNSNVWWNLKYFSIIYLNPSQTKKSLAVKNKCYG